MWPMLLDIPKDECKRILRRLELEAYGSLVSALRAQGELSKGKRQFLQEAANVFHISTERHRAEIRRAVNDEKLSTIAERLVGPNTGMEWAIEGRRLVPLMPRLTPQTAFTALANKIANATAAENAKLPPPQSTAQSPEIGELEEPAAPESSRTAQNQINTTASTSHQPLHQAPQVQTIKVEDTENRKRRRSSLEISGQPLSPQPLPKIAAVGIGSQPVPRTLTIPMNVAPVKLSIASTPLRSTASTSTASTTQKVIIMSGSTPVCSASLLQRSLSVPMVKTVATAGSLNAPCTLVSSSIGQARTTTTMVTGSISGLASHSGTQRIRPKPVTTATVLPRGRAGSIVIPITPNPPSAVATASVQLKPVGSMPHKPTLHIKQDGSGMKIIAGGPKLMPKPATVVATTSGATRVVTLTATPRVSPSLSSATVTHSQHQTSHLPTTYLTKPLTQIGLGTKTLPQMGVASTSTGATSKANVIVVKGTGYTGGQGVTLTQAGRELLGKVVLRNTQTQQGQKVSTSQAGTPQTITMQTGTRQGNVIVVDLSQEPIKSNTVLSEILQASGILTSTPSTPISTPQRIYLDDSNESQEEQPSPSSSTDTGSSLELNQAGDISLDDQDKMFAPSTSRTLEVQVTPKKTPTLLLSSAIQPQNIVTKSLGIAEEKLDLTRVTKQTAITEADMQKIEEEMMNLGEGTQLEVMQTELEQETNILVAPETTDSNETSDTQEMEVETSDQTCSLTLEHVNEDTTTSISNLMVEPVSENMGNIIFETASESSDNKIVDTILDEVSSTMDASEDMDVDQSMENAIKMVEQAAEAKNEDIVLMSTTADINTASVTVEEIIDSSVDEVIFEPSNSEEIVDSVPMKSIETKVAEQDIVVSMVEEKTEEVKEENFDVPVKVIESQLDKAIVEEEEPVKPALLVEPIIEECKEQDEESLLDPQSGILSVTGIDSKVSEESPAAIAEEPVKKIDIYSAAISSANITFDSEPEVSDPQHDDSEEDISLVYTECDEVKVDQPVHQSQQAPPVENKSKDEIEMKAEVSGTTLESGGNITTELVEDKNEAAVEIDDKVLKDAPGTGINTEEVITEVSDTSEETSKDTKPDQQN